MISDLEASKYQLVEWRISIYGRKASEWEKLAQWFYDNRCGDSSSIISWIDNNIKNSIIYDGSISSQCVVDAADWPTRMCAGSYRCPASSKYTGDSRIPNLWHMSRAFSNPPSLLPPCRKSGEMASFAEFLQNVFMPLFEVIYACLLLSSLQHQHDVSSLYVSLTPAGHAQSRLQPSAALLLA